jgi:hypothetical protein
MFEMMSLMFSKTIRNQHLVTIKPYATLTIPRSMPFQCPLKSINVPLIRVTTGQVMRSKVTEGVLLVVSTTNQVVQKHFIAEKS